MKEKIKKFLWGLTLFVVFIYPILIFNKKGAISSIRDGLVIVLVTRIILGERWKERKNFFIYALNLLMLVWWQYATVTGLDPSAGRGWYYGIMIKYFALPLLLSLVSINWNAIKKIYWVFLLASLPYWMFFVIHFKEVRFGHGWDTQHMAQLACGLSILSLLYLLYGNLSKSIKIIYGLLMVLASIMVIKSGVRGVWIAYITLTGVLCLAKNWKVTILVSLIAIGGFFKYAQTYPKNKMVNRVKSLDVNKLDISSTRRFKMWLLAPEVMKEKPIKGIGIKGFNEYSKDNDFLLEKIKNAQEKLKNPEIQKDLKEVKAVKRRIRELKDVRMGRVHIHNTFFEVLISTGIVGFLLYYSTLLLILKQVWNKFKSSKYMNEKIFFIWIILFNIMQLIYGLTEYTLSIEVVQQSIWFVMALALNYEVRKNEG